MNRDKLIDMGIRFSIAILIGLILGLGARYVMTTKAEKNPFRYMDTRTIQEPLPSLPALVPELSNKQTPSAPVTSKENQMEVITLTNTNHVVLDQTFTESSVNQVMRELQVLSERVNKNQKIYLVLNTPGGSVDAGLKLITFVKALPQKVDTLTIFAASMGFQTAQQLGDRLLLENGTLMSHRARFGISGEAPGELFTRLKWIMSMLDGLDRVASRRMGMTFDAYRELIRDEYWVYDEGAIRDNAADRKVLARCDSSLSGTRKTTVETFFGTFPVMISKCPLIPGIVSGANGGGTPETLNYVNLMFADKKAFVDSYIVNSKFEQFQK